MNKPIGMIIIVLSFIIVALTEGLRLFEALFFWNVLAKYHASPFYLGITGAFWLISASTLVFGIWQKKTWGWAGTIGGIICFAGWYWIDRIFIELPHTNWPFALGMTILLLLISTFIIFGLKTRNYFNVQESRND
jgi:hypothetical protein